MRRLTAMALTILCAPVAMQAQAGGPAECAQSASNWFNTAYKTARADAAKPGGKAVDTRALLDMRAAKLKECATAFDVAKVSGADLIALASLYTAAGMDSLAAAALEKRLADPALSENQRATALLAKIESLAKSDTLLVVRAEPYMQQLDAMPAAVWRQKLSAHQTLNGVYRYLDVNSRIEQHSRAIIALGLSIRATAPGDLSLDGVNAFGLLGAYANLAEVYGDFGHADSSLLVLQQARRDHPEVADSTAEQILGPERDRYELVGKPATTIAAGHWLNAAPGTKTFDPAGKVTVMEFTAHWCVPCRNSYPAMTAMAEQFGGRGVQFVFATQFYGFLGTRQGLDPAAEFAADREYFVAEHGIHFPVAIADAPPPYVPGQPLVQDPNFDRYKVGGIPETVIIDGHGVIRRILTGWDTGNALRIPVLLNQLLVEGSASTESGR